MLKKIVDMLGDMRSAHVFLGSFLITIMLSCGARAGMIDAFFFHKTKRQKKDDWKNLTVWQKIVLPYAALCSSNAPRHMRLLWWFRLINSVYLVSVGVFVWLAEHICASLAPYVNSCMLLKTLILDLPFVIYGLFCGGDPDNPKGWNFHLFRRP